MEEKNVAILIDGDNIAPKYAKLIKEEADKYGNITVFRLYGSTTAPTIKAWMPVMPKYGITPLLQLSYANNKSIADQALTIDAMDILYSRKVDVFFLVTSDSDFTKLAYRLKESGKTIIGMGERKTPESLASACNEFKLIDVLYNTEGNGSDHVPAAEDADMPKTEVSEASDVVAVPVEPAELPKIEIPKEKTIVKMMLANLDSEWENLADIGNVVTKGVPGFDVRNYNHKTFSSFVKAHQEAFEVREELGPDRIHKVIFIRKAEEKKPEKNVEKKPENKAEKKPEKKSSGKKYNTRKKSK